MDQNNSQIILYQTADGKTKVEVKMDGETVWLTQDQMAELFEKGRSTVAEHILNAFKERELNEESVCREFRRTGTDGKEYTVNHYNLDVIISVGYRVTSVPAPNFANGRPHACASISSKVLLWTTLDSKSPAVAHIGASFLIAFVTFAVVKKRSIAKCLICTPQALITIRKNQASVTFFKTVQNKLHYATNRQTAAELIFVRADAEIDLMGLTTFDGAMPSRQEISTAKNYLTEDELFRLNRLVSAFFDLAEIKAQERTPMHMKDWVAELDKFAGMYGKGVHVKMLVK